MNTIYRILGKRGRITIPFVYRCLLGFRFNDVVSFTLQNDGVFVKWEKLCSDCKQQPLGAEEIKQLAGNLSKAEQRQLLVILAANLGEGGVGSLKY